jgi:hypothetical protein
MRTIDYVYSPDDGGWYAQETDFDSGKSRVTKRIYPTKDAVIAAINAARPERLVWESWS